MKVELDTNSVSSKDLEMLRILDTVMPGKLRNAQDSIDFLKAEVDRLENEHRVEVARLEKENVNLRMQLANPKIHIKKKGFVSEMVADLFKEKDASYTSDEMQVKLGLDDKTTIYAALATLLKKGVIDASVKRPKRYFLRGADPELLEALRGAKVSKFGGGAHHDTSDLRRMKT